MLTAEQLEERKGYIGASEAAAVLGLSRWVTPLQLWAIKSGQVVAEDISQKLQVKLGHKLESVVSELFTEETGLKLRKVNETVYHPKYKFIACNLDRKIEGLQEVVEIKTVAQWREREFDEGQVPAEFLCQVYHQLACTGYKRGHLAILIGNSDFKRVVVERDEKAIAALIEKERYFWQTFVEPKVMPGIIGAGDSETLFQLFPTGDDAEPVALDDKADAMIESFQALKADALTLKDHIEKSGNEIKALLKDKSVGKSARWTVTWKNESKTNLDTDRIKKEAPEVYARYGVKSEYRVLRPKQSKEK